MGDLFGMETYEAGESLQISTRPALVLTPAKPRGKHYVEPRGYVAPPGTGPEGMKCKNCAHYTHQGGVSGAYPKCGANRARWTGGRGSDILANAPACNRFMTTGGGEDGGR